MSSAIRFPNNHFIGCRLLLSGLLLIVILVTCPQFARSAAVDEAGAAEVADPKQDEEKDKKQEEEEKEDSDEDQAEDSQDDSKETDEEDSEEATGAESKKDTLKDSKKESVRRRTARKPLKKVERKDREAAALNAEEDEKEGDTPKKRGKRSRGRRVVPKNEPAAAETPEENEEDGAKPPKVDVSPNLRKRVDELLESEGKPGRGNVNRSAEQRRRRGRRGATSRSKDENAVRQEGSVSAASAEAEPSETTLDIPPTPPEENRVPAEERTYWIGLEDVTYEQLIDAIARQTGLAVQGVIPKGGRVSFVTEEELTFEALLARVRQLLFQYKPHEPYWMLRKETHLEVVRVNDILRILPGDRMFRSAEEFLAAELPDHELVLMLYTPSSGSVAGLQVVRDFMPDYVRVTPLEGKNTVTIFALASDIHKYLEMVRFFIGTTNVDPRTLEKIKVEYVTPTDAVAKLGELMDLDGKGAARRPRPRGKRKKETSPLIGVEEPEVTVVPIDAHGIILVRAMEDKIAEIKLLLPFIDLPDESSYDPQIIPIKHADPGELIKTIESILLTSAGQSAGRKASAGKRKKPQRSPKSGGTTASAGDVTMITHPSASAIIVMADEESLAKVRRLVEMFDVADGVRNETITLQHRQAGDLVDILQELLADPGAPKGRKKGSVRSGHKLVASPNGDALWFTGSRKDFETVQEMVVVLDTPGEEVTLHIKPLVNQLPSFVAGILKQYDGGAVTATPSARRAGRKGRKSGRKPAASKFTPDDGQGLLYVLCTETEWQEYLPLIEQLESELPGDEFVLIPVEHIDPSDAIKKISAVMAHTVEADAISYETVPSGMIVMGAAEHELETIRSLLEEFDQPIDMEERIFEIKYGDPSEIAAAVESLISAEEGSGAPAPGRRKGGKKAPRGLAAAVSGGPSLTIVELDRRLIVRASPETMERVAGLIETFDVPGHATDLRVYDDFPPDADIEWIAGTLSDTLVGPTRVRRPGAKKGAAGDAEGPKFIPQPAARKLLVIAPPASFEEIERLLEVLKHTGEQEPVIVEFFDVEFADPEELVESVQPLLDLRVGQLEAAGELAGAVGVPASGAGKPRKPGRKARPAPGRQGPMRSYHMAAVPGRDRVVVAGPQLIVDEAKGLIAALDKPGDEPDRIEIAYVKLTHADPEELVASIGPLLDLKIQQLLETGELSEPTGKAAPPTPRKGKRRVSTPGRAGGALYHLEPDVRHQRVVIAAPLPVIEDAKQLIAEFDQPGSDDKPIFRTVALHNAEPGDMVEAISELMGAGKRPRRAKVRKPGATQPAQPEAVFKIVEAPSGGAVVLQGTVERVTQAVEWIEELDGLSVSDRLIKVYQIEVADLRRLVDLIVADVGTPSPRTPKKPQRSVRQQAARMQAAASESEEDEFATTIMRTAENLYIQADLIERTMVVSASPSKMSRIDEIVAMMDSEDEIYVMGNTSIPRVMIELKHADPFDAAIALEGVFEAMWEPSDSLPKVDYYDTFGDVLVVRYPDESRFEQIEQWVTKFVDKPDPEKIKPVKKALLTLPGMSALDTARLLQLNHPELDIELIDISTADDKTWNMAEVVPPTKTRGNPCVLPLSFHRAAATLLAASTGQVETDDPDPDPEPDEAEEGESLEEPSADEDEGAEAELLDPLDASLQEVGMSLLEEGGGAGNAGDDVGDVGSDAKGVELDDPPRTYGAEKIKLYYNDEGQLLVEGTRGVVQGIPDMLEELKEELKDLPRPPDIRIYRLRFIDVYSAQTIINEMFNATQSQRAQVRAQQQRAAATRQRQQQQQRRQQQQQKGQPGAQPGQAGRPGQRTQQGRAQVAQLPTPTVRVYPNARDRTLILRADTNQFPALLKLLATIDQPKPINSTHRIFQLKKLKAADVEELLTDWLGLNEPRQRRAARPSPRRGAGRRPGAVQPVASPGSQLPKTILQKTVDGRQELGVDPEDIKISSNEQNNTILVMAPKAALDYIEKLINELESYDLPERNWKNYKLKYADVDEAVEFLSERYGTDGAGRGRAGTRRKGGTSKGPEPTRTAGLTPPTFVSFSRLNMISAQATEEQFEEIDGLIAELDAPRVEDEFHSVTLKAADAKVVADTLTAMFGKGGSSRGRGPKGRPTPSAGQGATFIGEEGGKIVFFSAPQHQHERIIEVIAELEEQSKVETKVRVIQLEFGKASRIAEAIEGAYGTGRSSGRSRGGKKGATAVRQFTVTPSDATKRLFVLADDDLFLEIESLAKSLDTPTKMDAEFKVFPLQYANAKESHETMTNLVTDYLKRLPRDTPMEPFSVEVNEEANALVVLGSPMIFGFVEEALSSIDTPANEYVPPAVLMVPLKNADATEVAQAITRLWASRDSRSGTEPPKAEANRAMNLLIVRGTRKQIDEIKKDILDPLEEQEQQALQTETIALKFARADEVGDLITRIFEDQKRAAQGVKGGRPKTALESTVAVTADTQTNQLIVQASAANLEMIKNRVALIDTEEVAEASATSTKVYTLDKADPSAVANIIKEWGRAKTQGKSSKQSTAPGDMVMAVAEPWTQTVVVTAAEPNHKLIQKMIDDLDAEDQANQMNVHVINLANAEAEAVSRTLNDILVRTAPKQAGKTPAVSAVQGSKAVMVRCSNKDFEMIQGLIEELDQEDVVVGEEIRAITLQFTDATEMHETLKEYLAKPGTKARTPTLVGDTRISVLSQTNAIVMSGDRERVERLESLVRDLDKAGEKGSVPQIIPLEHIEVAQVLPTLLEAFSESSRGGGRSGARQPIIVGNEAVGGLVVRADPTDMAAIEATVALLDTPEAGAAEMFKLVSVSQGINVEDLADMLEISINASTESQAPSGSRRNQRIPRITVTPDRRTRTLLLTGSAQLFGVAEKMVSAYEEKGPSKGMGIRIIRLRDVAATDVERLVAQLKGESSRSQGRSSRRAGSSGRRGSRSSSTSSGSRRSSGGRRSSGTSPRRTSGSRRRR